MHGAGGNVLSFRDVARRLGADQTFYGLQAPGVDGAPPLESIEATADLHLKEVPRGAARRSLRLGGYSAGGLIAYEMAQRLRAQGHELPVLVFFDTLAAGVRGASTSPKEHLRRLRADGPAYLPRRARAGSKSQRARGRPTVRWCAYRGGPMPLELRDLSVRAALRAATENYRPMSYTGSTTCIEGKR